MAWSAVQGKQGQITEPHDTAGPGGPRQNGGLGTLPWPQL